MRHTIAFLLVLTSSGIAEAQTVYGFPDTLAVVPSGRLSRIGVISHIDVDCRFMGYNEVQVSNAAANGTIFTQRLSAEHPTFPLGTDHYHCNKYKRPAIGVFYKSTPGFSGRDHVTISWIDENHVPVYKPYTLQVQ